MDAVEPELEQTLHVAPSVSVFRVPVRGPTGFCSANWKVQDKLFEGRLRVVAKGELCEVRLEDGNTGALFAVSPVPYGKRLVYVEPAVDSSRNFVIRVEDSATKQHAFLGLSFAERADSFDFNEALLRHEKHVERERATAAVAAGGAAAVQQQAVAAAGARQGARAASSSSSAGSGHAVQEVAKLYAQHDDYALKEGQTIKVNITKKALKPGGLMSSAAAAGAGLLRVPLPPPPS